MSINTELPVSGITVDGTTIPLAGGDTTELENSISAIDTRLTTVEETVSNLDNTYATDSDVSALTERVTALESGGSSGGTGGASIKAKPLSDFLSASDVNDFILSKGTSKILFIEFNSGINLYDYDEQKTTITTESVTTTTTAGKQLINPNTTLRFDFSQIYLHPSINRYLSSFVSGMTHSISFQTSTTITMYYRTYSISSSGATITGGSIKNMPFNKFTLYYLE